MSQPYFPGRRLSLVPAALLLASSLAACTFDRAADRSVPTASVPEDYHLRHPVVLTEAPDHLEIFAVGGAGRLDTRDLHALDAFVAQYRLSGHGPIVVRAPEGPVDRLAIDRTVAAVRRALIGFGARGGVEIEGYPVADPRLAAPLHLSFVRLQARIASRCGDWPDDLNTGATLHGWENRSYYNLGCANAQTLAAQIDDPRDLLEPRPEDPSDVQLRTRAIGLLRGTPGSAQGKDPGTVWTGSAPSPISTIGAN